MKKKQIAALAFIFFCTSFAWLILGMTTTLRTTQQDTKLSKSVSQLWGTIQKQNAPRLYRLIHSSVNTATPDTQANPGEENKDVVAQPCLLDSSAVNVKLHLDQRQKGLLWYSTYQPTFEGTYLISNPGAETGQFCFEYRFPVKDGLYDSFQYIVDGQKITDLKLTTGVISKWFTLNPGEHKKITISYRTQGLDEWWYVFGDDVSQLHNFRLTMLTDFDKVDFMEESISPTQKERTENGWKLTWQYDDLISGVQIGIKMPQKLNPGPFVSRLSFFAPVSLFFFLFIMFIITSVKQIKLHSMNYFFIAASFFAYHLLLAYLADHINIHLAVAISSLVSIFLVISYMRLVIGLRFALLETGISQFVYLLLFSYAFFFEGYTGLTITVLSIVTLFVVMQTTAHFNWDSPPKEVSQQAV
jgi:hypothetical protein